ncbi:MAG: SDR family oxidoreductase [Saprospiraceae bacterium]|nr:SDR family oxidoreductase [Saprospiraceae bacterium]
MDLQLRDKVAVISGGSVGIGLAIANGLAQEGVHLALCARNQSRLDEEVQNIRNTFGVKVIGHACDVTDPAAIERFVAYTEREFGGADILLNNAGTGSNEKIADAEDAKWQYFWDLHVMAAVRLSRSFMPLMAKRGGGVILNNSSICAKQPLGYEPIYNTTKAALSMFSKCLANECIPMNIRVNTINPGLILTKDWWSTAEELSQEQGITPKEYLDNIAKENTPIGRFASPEELAAFFVFMCSPKASYCVGSTYYVDGGWLKVVE